MAEALMRAKAPAVADVSFASAGIAALVGEPADAAAIQLLQGRGLDITAHRARQLTPDMVHAADLILVMEAGHQQHIHSLAPATRGRVHRIGKWSDRDIPDPYKKSPEYFEYVFGLIEQDVDAWSHRLWSC